MKTLPILATTALLAISASAVADKMCGTQGNYDTPKLNITYHSVDSHIEGVNPIDVNVDLQAVTGYGCIEKTSGTAEQSQFIIYGADDSSANWSINAQLKPSQGIFYGAIQAGKDTSTSVPVGGGPNGEKNYGVCYSSQSDHGPWTLIDKGKQTVETFTGNTINVYLAWAPEGGCSKINESN